MAVGGRPAGAGTGAVLGARLDTAPGAVPGSAPGTVPVASFGVLVITTQTMLPASPPAGDDVMGGISHRMVDDGIVRDQGRNRRNGRDVITGA
ncbi:hypothetical protein GCM10010977_18800 [Citricoccus zhacaiensis]|uniref:Uncharacterized protein n=1 Tax=Citricoccus zhacaiensis TaxID=489142 RepID=A0ABQ2M153_9MICC|nr:hypothetical protein GCM10010977_18800 [Citricoccus zhacaiensis]